MLFWYLANISLYINAWDIYVYMHYIYLYVSHINYIRELHLYYKLCRKLYVWCGKCVKMQLRKTDRLLKWRNCSDISVRYPMRLRDSIRHDSNIEPQRDDATVWTKTRSMEEAAEELISSRAKRVNRVHVAGPLISTHGEISRKRL